MRLFPTSALVFALAVPAAASRLVFPGADQPNGYYANLNDASIFPVSASSNGLLLDATLTFDGTPWGGLFNPLTDLPNGAIDLDYRFQYQIPESLAGAIVKSAGLSIIIGPTNLYPFILWSVPITTSTSFQHLTIPLLSFDPNSASTPSDLSAFPFAYISGSVVINSPSGLAESGLIPIVIPVELDLKNVTFGNPIPEPSTGILIFGGMIALLIPSWRRRSTRVRSSQWRWSAP